MALDPAPLADKTRCLPRKNMVNAQETPERQRKSVHIVHIVHIVAGMLRKDLIDQWQLCGLVLTFPLILF